MRDAANGQDDICGGLWRRLQLLRQKSDRSGRRGSVGRNSGGSPKAFQVQFQESALAAQAPLLLRRAAHHQDRHGDPRIIVPLQEAPAWLPQERQLSPGGGALSAARIWEITASASSPESFPCSKAAHRRSSSGIRAASGSVSRMSRCATTSSASASCSSGGSVRTSSRIMRAFVFMIYPGTNLACFTIALRRKSHI